MSRKQSRITAFKLIYAGEHSDGFIDLYDEGTLRIIGEGELPMQGPEVEYIKNLCDAVSNNISDIDEIIDMNSANFEIARIAKVELAVLRLCIAEMMFTETSNVVVVSEGVDIAKKYGNENSGEFVNGLLRKISENVDKV